MNPSRRKFLKDSALSVPGSVLTVGVLEQLLLSIATGVVSKALAAENNQLPRNYLNIFLNGGWSHASFNSFLIPKGKTREQSIINNPGFGTAFTVDSSKKITGLEYKTFNYKGIETPWIWQYDVMGGLGGRKPMSALLDNMAVIRGFTSGNDGHELNAQKITYPEPNHVSISGSVADASARPFAAVYANVTPNYFNSAKGKSLTNASFWTNPLVLLKRSFDLSGQSANVLNKRSQYKESIDLAMQALTSMINGSGPQASALKDNIDSANKMFNSAAEDLNSIWSSLFLKYKTVIDASVNPAILYPEGIPFLTDNPILTPSTISSLNKPNPWQIHAGMGGMYPHPNQDLRGVFTTAYNDQKQTIKVLAEILALAEYTFSRELSNCILNSINEPVSNINFHAANFTIGPATNLMSDGITLKTNAPDKGVSTFLSDEHFTGAYSSLLSQACWTRGLGAGILEFKESLNKKSTSDGKNLWEETVVHISTDFARSPRSSLVGSDHGWYAHYCTLFSGAVTNGPVVTGNIQINNKGPNKTEGSPVALYGGTWGAHAKVDFGGVQEYLSLKHVAGSIAHVLRVSPNPWPFNNRVWTLNDKVLNAIEAKNV